jgi:hypothetical protein
MTLEGKGYIFRGAKVLLFDQKNERVFFLKKERILA